MAVRQMILVAAMLSPLACNEGRMRDVQPAPGAAADTNVSFQRLTDAVAAKDVDLPRAIAAAEAAVGGTAIEAELALTRKGAPAYEVEVVTDGKVQTVVLDADSFTVTKRRDDRFDSFDAVDADLARRANWQVLVAAAEGETGGNAFDIETDGEDGQFELEVLANGVVWDVVVTPEGRVVRSERDDGQWDDDQFISRALVP